METKIRMKKLCVGLLIVIVLGCSPMAEEWIDWNKNGSMDPYENPDLSVEERDKDLIHRMTLEEKVSQMGDSAPAIERLGISKYKWWNECLHGVCGKAHKTTVFPQAIGLASTWNPDLIYEVAESISDEARALANIEENQQFLTFWSPVVNIGRDPRWGRTQEGYGEDPYLVSRLGVAFVRGLQGNHPKYLKVISTPKHFAVNNEEGRRHSGSAEVDERILREYYLPAFKACIVEGKAHSVMGAYNAINGIPCCCNKKLLTHILRDEWGFDGYVVSDCGAISDIYQEHHFVETAEEAAASSVIAGTDLNCLHTYQEFLVNAVVEGLITEEYIDIAVGRLFTARFRLGMFDPSEMVPYSQISSDVIDSKKHRELALRTAQESIVLLKNENNLLLPLNKKIKSIAVIGPNANICQFGNYSGTPSKAISPLEGIKNLVSAETKVYYAPGCLLQRNALPTIPTKYLVPIDANEGQHGLKGEYFNNMDFSGKPVLTRIDKQINFDYKGGSPDELIRKNNFSIRWSGKLIPPATKTYKISVTTDDGVRLYIDGELLVNQWHMRGPTTNVVSKKLKAGHPYDIRIEYYEETGGASAHLGWEPLTVDPLKEAINLAKKADAIIIVVGTDLIIEGEGNDRDNLDLPNDQKKLIKQISKVNSNSVVVLVNGSPLSINWTKENIPAILEAWFPGEEGGNAIADVIFGNYNPGGKLPMTFYTSVNQLPPFDDYDITKGRTYMYLKEKPLFPFGHGLSYTKFKYSNLELNQRNLETTEQINISLYVENVGDLQGDEVVQLYAGDFKASVARPIKELVGFKRINLKPGEKKKITFTLPVEELSFYDVDKKKFVVKPGKFKLMVGSSSDDIRLKDSFEVMNKCPQTN